MSGRNEKIELAPNCTLWTPENETHHPIMDRLLLESLNAVGFVTFTGPSGLCGGKSEQRTALAIHRGRRIRWEVVFREHDTDIVSTTTNNLELLIPAALAWLNGRALIAAENSLYAVAG